MEQLLALFPLNTVLFPGAVLSLHIFEQRYRQMINRCIQLKQPFGVVLIRDGVEVDGAAEPYEIGTTAEIQNVLRFPDGRMLLAAQGTQRFQINEIIQREPYLVANVTLLDDDVSPEVLSSVAEVRALYSKHREALTNATGIAQHLDDLPDDPIAVAYQLSDRFRVVNSSKQQLLEADLDDRLGAIIEALNRELRLLPPVPTHPPQTHDGPWTLN